MSFGNMRDRPRLEEEDEKEEERNGDEELGRRL